MKTPARAFLLLLILIVLIVLLLHGPSTTNTTMRAKAIGVKTVLARRSSITALLHRGCKSCCR